MPELNVVQLVGEWEVQVTPVPPHASFKWVGKNVKYPEKPPRPVVELRSPLLPEGAPPETAPALPDSPEWDAWMEQLGEWQKQCDKVREAKAADEMEFSLDYAVLGWRRKGSEDEWLYEPGENWNPNPALERHGLDEDLSRRMKFIHYELMAQSQNFDLIMLAAFPQGERDTSPITDEEVGAALAGFRTGGMLPGESRRMGTTTGSIGSGGQAAHPHVKIGQGDASGGRKASVARRLVFLFTGK